MSNNVLYVQLSNIRNPQCYPDIEVAVCQYIATAIVNPKHRQTADVVRLQNPMQVAWPLEFSHTKTNIGDL